LEFKFAVIAPDSSGRNDRNEKYRLSNSRLDSVFPQLAVRDCRFVLPKPEISLRPAQLAAQFRLNALSEPRQLPTRVLVVLARVAEKAYEIG
jgi:hypothetical protein